MTYNEPVRYSTGTFTYNGRQRAGLESFEVARGSFGIGKNRRQKQFATGKGRVKR